MSVKKSAVFIFLSILVPQITAADITTTSLPVSTIVTTNCSLSSASLNFGSYDPVGANKGAPLNGEASFQVACTKGANVVITMNNGLNSAYAQGTTRAMSSNNNDYLSYELYSDSGRSNVWTNSNTVNYVSTSSAPRTQTVYGKIPANQNKSAGNYTDTVTITATF